MTNDFENAPETAKIYWTPFAMFVHVAWYRSVDTCRGVYELHVCHDSTHCVHTGGAKSFYKLVHFWQYDLRYTSSLP